ncbi:MAG TPA: isoprenylcysteine carboxylmethyltransferase family protein [Ignavibacteria bacterium]
MNIFFLTYIIWILSEIILNRFIRSGKSDKKSADKNTELYLWVSIIVSITIGIFVRIKFSSPIFVNEQLALIGIIVIIIGIIIRFITIKQLGRLFTVDVTIRDNHQLMQNGFYKYLRHPSYTGSLLSFLGFGLSLNNWFTLTIVFLPILIAFIYRMNIEENVLSEKFGKQYQDYISKTKRLIPFVY